ncbi:hypothetical protein FQN55_000550 [Onygenales sp. PD_40]|nr:hypothetical protein FQN55_000550 [Onygenales sp. PD_40]
MSPTAIPEVPSVNSLVTKGKGEQQQEQEKHVHGGEGLTALQAISHGGIPIPGVPSFTSHELKRQWQLEHMAGAFRIWARHGYVEGMSGHISVRDPEHTNAFWTNPLAVHFGMLKASDMILVDLAGNVVGGNRTRPANAAGFLIHAAVHKARADVHAVCHAHTIYGKAWSTFARPLEMLNQDVCKFYGAHSVYASYGGVVLAAEEGEMIAKALGDGKGAILMNHGLLTVGGTVDEAAYLFGLMERSCQVQLLAENAAASGITKQIITDEEAEYNHRMESDPEALYCEFQPDYEYEDMLSNGAFKK